MTAGRRRLKAVFMRGGTSKALVFHRRDLPADEAEWPALFLAVMGSPDPNGRQLDGMGGGVTSLSKVCVIGPPTRDDADIDYSFFQILVREARVLTHGNCGNMSAAMGPFAVDEGLVPVRGPEAVVRIHNTNTRKLIHASFALDADRRAAVDGDFAIPGVAGSGAPVRLDFLDPGGASTGRLLPTGRVLDVLDVPGLGPVEVSIVDAANLAVFVAAGSVGLDGTELPEALERNGAALDQLRTIGALARVAAGAARSLDEARAKLPFVAIVSGAQATPTLSGQTIAADAADLVIRMLSSGQPHRALPGTGSIAAAVAMQLPGSIAYRLARQRTSAARTLAMPSGALTVEAVVQIRDGAAHAVGATVQRTARRLFEGVVYA